MRVSRKKAAEHRDRIVDVAARLFRERGFDGVGIDTIMQAAGLTHGGFYGHFRSKDDLAAVAVTRALQQSAERQDRLTSLDELVGDYLTERHCADRASGCAIAGLGADIARHGEGTRRGSERRPRCVWVGNTSSIEESTSVSVPCERCRSCSV